MIEQKDFCSPFIIDDDVLEELATLNACGQLAGIDDELINEVLEINNLI